MGVWVRVRGWVDCDAGQLPGVRAVIAGADDGGYSRGWVVAEEAPGFTECVFFGGDLREQAVGWLLQQVRDIAALPPSDADGDRVLGLVVLVHEAGGVTTWKVGGGEVEIAPVAGLGFLDGAAPPSDPL